jgi:uncharacterized repeat protein (TIGR01451 family)/LPXTG-motif cell wall-anchored protein
MKKFSPNNKIYGFIKISMVAITIVSTVGFSPIAVLANSESQEPLIPIVSCPPAPICGDGTVNQISEQCDDGNLIDGDGCDSQCQTEAPELCAPGETLTQYTYNSKPQFVYIDNSAENVVEHFCTDSPGESLSINTDDGQPHYFYLTWDNIDFSNYPNFLSFDLLLKHQEYFSTFEVELKNGLGDWVKVCDPAESTTFIWDTCDLVLFSDILKETGKAELRVVSVKTDACHVFLKCAKIEAELYDCEAPEPYCGDGIKNQLTEQCDGTDWVGEHQACTQDCQLIDLPWCGDGIKNDAEECDGTDGVGEHQACTEQCTIVNLDWCGDGVKNGDEECDGTDGVSEHYLCTDNCTLEYVPYCGDNIVQEPEQCDDGNIIDGDGCTANCTIEQPVCDGTKNLIINGGFESPLIADSQSWNIYSNSQINGWKIEWVSLTPSEYLGYSRPIDAYLELQNSNVGWDPQEGSQFAELDSDWDGPSGSLNGEPASAKIYQDISTIPGTTYHISFWFSPRPNTGLEDNRLQFKWDSEVKDTLEAAGENNTTWTEHEYTFTASGDITRLYFTDLGLANSEGTFLDNVSVKCVPPQEPICGDNVKNQESEECDGTDGVGEHQSCSQECTLIDLPWCGDGIKNLTEECDGTDGVLEHYTCTDQCVLQYIPYCGDDIINQDVEQCDGTAGVGENQACTAECMLINIPFCGNGVKDGEEQCDGTDGVTEHHICTVQCTLEYIPYCGDNTVNQTSEQCDDGNLTNGDGCSATCQLEQNEPSCGNGVIEGSEACDNGLQNGVGCNPACGNTCSYCTVQCTVATNTGGTCGGGGGGGGGGDNPFPALAIMKSVAETSTNPGGIVNYTVKVKNNAFATAKNVILKDTLPAGFTFQDTGLAEKEWSLGDITYGVEKITTFQAVVGIGVGIGDYKNTAMAKADNQGAIYANALIPVIIGQVLGARTELPNTGTDPILFIIVGLGIIITSLLTLLWFQRKIKLQINN